VTASSSTTQPRLRWCTRRPARRPTPITTAAWCSCCATATAAGWCRIGFFRETDGAPIDLLLAPHHGSHTSSTPRFVSALRPRRVIFSRRREIPRQVVRRYREAGARGWFTRHSGTLEVRFDPKWQPDPRVTGFACADDGAPYNGWGFCP
jgi:hypothetical protein